jgi:hypothetical protein
LIKRVGVLLSAAAMAAVLLSAGGIAWAQEEGQTSSVSSSPTINPTPDDTWMTNSGGKVYAVVRSGGYIYVGGQFTSIRSAATGGQSFAATNLARFRADTGAGDPAWTPDVTGEDMTKTKVYALAASGGKIWVGGKFGAVDGVARRNLAAVSPDTSVVDPNIDPVVGTETSMVRAMIASDTKVYIGGAFGTIQDDKGLKGRKNIAAINPLTGNVDLTWKPKTAKIVWSLAPSCDGPSAPSTVFAGGKFQSAAGSDGVFATRKFIARFDAASGALHPWATPVDGWQSQEEVASDLAVTCERITSGFLGPNLLRSFRLDNGNTGSVVWQYKTGGEVQTAAMLGPDKVVVGGHFSQLDGIKRTRIGMVDLATGVPDESWKPAVEGKYLGPWDLLVDENRLYVGGEFTSVGGLPRYNFARFTFTP